MVGLILCAGLGSGLKPLTDKLPKCMIPVANKPILEHIADYLNKHGVWRIVVNLHLFPGVVMKHFGQRFLYLYESIPMGEFATTSIVRQWFPDEILLVANGDTITDVELVGVPYFSRLISKKTGKHMGTTIYGPKEMWAKDYEVDCNYFDIGTPEKLSIARKHYEH